LVIIRPFRSNPSSFITKAYWGTSLLYISTITELELFSFSDLSIDEEFKINRLLQTVAILPLSSRIARTAGHLRSIHRMGVADSAIAATALFTGSVLLTRNTRDFKRVTTLRTQLV